MLVGEKGWAFGGEALGGENVISCIDIGTTFFFPPKASTKYVKVPQHGPTSLYTKLEGPSMANLDLHFP